MTAPEALAAFEDLAPAVARLRALQRRCRPFSGDYAALALAIEGLREAAEIVTGRPDLYSASGAHR